jgi:hypothetical protein
VSSFTAFGRRAILAVVDVVLLGLLPGLVVEAVLLGAALLALAGLLVALTAARGAL